MQTKGLAVVVAALVLSLAACTAPDAPPSAVPVETRPAFPRLEGRTLETALPARGDWLIRISVDDAGAAYPRAQALLTDAGYVLTKDRRGSGGGDGQACTQRLCVSFTATDDPRYGPSVLYEVFHGSGVG